MAPDPDKSSVLDHYFASRTIRRAAACCGAAAILLGLLALLARATGLLILGSFIPGAQVMVPAVSLCSLVLGACVLLLAFSRQLPRTLLLAATAFVFIMSVLMSLEQLPAFDWGTGNLFLSWPSFPLDDPRGSLATTVGLMMLSGACALFCWPTRRSLAMALAYGGAALGATFVLGYMYGRPLLYGTDYTPIALPAALNLMLVGTGVALLGSAWQRAAQAVLAAERTKHETAAFRLAQVLTAEREQAQQRAEELDAVFNSIPDGVMVYDAEGNLLQSNPAMQAFHRYTEAETKRPLPERLRLLNPRGADGEAVAHDDMPTVRALRGETVIAFQMTTYPGTDRECTCVYSGAPLHGSEGQIIGAVVTATDVTELRRAIAQAERGHSLLKTVFETAPAATVVTDAEGQIIMTNPLAQELYARPVPYGEPLESHVAMQLCYPDGTPYEPNDLPLSQSVLTGKSFENVHMLIIWPDGQTRHLLVNTTPIRDESGAIAGAVGAFRDWTPVIESVREQDRLMAELQHHRDHLERVVAQRTAELQERSRVLESVFNNSLSCLVLLDTEFNFIRVNQSFATASGRTIEDFAGHNYFVDYPTEEAKAAVREVVRTQTPWCAVAYPHVYPPRPDAGMSYWDVSVVPIVDAGGQVEMLLASMHDVTARKRTEQLIEQRTAELIESEANYRELVENANSVIIKWDKDGILTVANEYAHRLFGYAPGEMLGKSAVIILPERTSAGHAPDDIRDGIWSNPKEWTYNENENVTRDGRLLWLAWTNRVIPGSDGEIEGIMSIGTDRTAQHQAEQQLLAYQEQLRQLTGELTLAEQRERQRIASLIHDEVAQPLGAIKLHLSMMKGQHPSAEDHIISLLSMTDEATRASRTIMTELSPPVLQRLGLVEAVGWWAEVVRERDGMTVKVETVGDQGRLGQAQEVTMFQAIKELLQNVVKHAGTTEAEVWLEWSEECVRVTVRDTGVGFDPAALQTTISGGFGLFSVQERIEYLGGEVMIIAEPGRGSEIVLALPVS